MVRLRGHHLICLQFFRGEGYNREFIENLSHVLKLATNEGVTLAEGGDDICAACPSYTDERCTHQPGGEEKIQNLDALATELLNVEKTHLSWSEIRDQIPAIIEEWRKKACESCEWKVVCEKNETWNSI